jgi:hypothetical protein
MDKKNMGFGMTKEVENGEKKGRAKEEIISTIDEDSDARGPPHTHSLGDREKIKYRGAARSIWGEEMHWSSNMG